MIYDDLETKQGIKEVDMAHKVNLKISSGVTVAKADVEFEVKKDKSVVGTLKVSKGAVEWRPKNWRRTFKMKWTDFDRFFRKHGKEKK